MADEIIQPADPVSVDLGPIYDQAGQKYGLDPNVLRAIGQQESSGNPLAVGPPVEGGRRALGVMQILSSNLQPYGVSNWQDPAQNIDAGAHILKDMLAQHKGDMASALQSYSGGAPGYADQVLGRMAPIEPAGPGDQPPAPQGTIEPADTSAPEPGFFSAAERAIGQEAAAGKQTLTGQAFTDQKAPAAPPDELQKRMDQSFWNGGWRDPAWWGAQLGHMSPTLAGAAVGAVGAGAVAGPEAAPIGAGAGAIAGNAATQISSAYQAARAQGLDHDAAVNQALVETGIGSTVIGVMSALPGGSILGKWAEGTLKRAVSEFLVNANIAGAAGAAGTAATAAVEGKPLTLDDLLSSYTSNVVLGGGLDLVHRAASAVLPESRRPEEPTPTPQPTPGQTPETTSPSVAPATTIPEANAPSAELFPREQFAPTPAGEQVVNAGRAGLNVDNAALRAPIEPATSTAEAPRGPQVGDHVQVNIGGAYQLREPAPLRDIQTGPDGKQYGFVEGSQTGLPLDQIEVVRPKVSPATPEPQPPIKPAVGPKAGAVGMPKPIPGTGDLKTRATSESVQASAIQKELVDSFGDLPGYQVLQDPGQGEKALQFLQGDPDKARQAAMGEAQPPRGVLQSAVFVAVKQAAEDAGDVDTLKDLATKSKFLSSITRLGQEISYLRNIDSSTDPVKIMNMLQKAYDDRVTMKNLQPKIDRQVNEAQAGISKAVPRPGRAEWDAFAQAIMCR